MDTTLDLLPSRIHRESNALLSATPRRPHTAALLLHRPRVRVPSSLIQRAPLVRVVWYREEYYLVSMLHTTLFLYFNCFYDPSAGSPTETLLRLLLPLSAPVRASFRRSHSLVVRRERPDSPKISLVHPIGSSDGRCVQRAGT